MAERKVESENLEETRKIGTGLDGNKHAYTSGTRDENEFIVDNRPEAEREREKEREKGDMPEDGTWENAKRFLDPDSK
ncbi:MAG: hypothetical protein JO092_05245 [Candidatus Eremiobacteraeota bacterium]|nr:hypothetical protein [Candidatus Eremiobacteraeota bacterium]